VKDQPAEKLIAPWKSETDKNDLLQRQSFLFMCLYQVKDHKDYGKVQ
jgi:hypothetical protein